jgi:uncharacterized protein
VRVFLDTNVLVSAYASRGLCADVLRLVLAEHELICAEVVLEELQRILRQKIRIAPEIVQDVIEFLREAHVEPRPSALPELSVRDPDDAWVLASAIQAEAEVLITGDPDLLDIAAEVKSIQILNPRGFWELNRVG